MTDITKTILGTAVGLQSVALVGQNMKLLPKMSKGKIKMAKVTPKKLLKTGLTNIVGIGLIKAQSDIIKSI